MSSSCRICPWRQKPSKDIAVEGKELIDPAIWLVFARCPFNSMLAQILTPKQTPVHVYSWWLIKANETDSSVQERWGDSSNATWKQQFGTYMCHVSHKNHVSWFVKSRCDVCALQLWFQELQQFRLWPNMIVWPRPSCRRYIVNVGILFGRLIARNIL